jgi:cell surface protein SprA
MQNVTRQFNGRTAVELFRGFRIEVSVSRSETRNRSEFFRWDPRESQYRSFDPFTAGNFSMSYIFIGTAFEDFSPEFSEAFQQFSDNRQIISARLASDNPNTDNLVFDGPVEGGYRNGYLGNSQDVLVPALLSAYGVISPNKITLSPYPLIPLPNWSVNYNGLSNISFLKNVFNSVTLKHAYRAMYTVGNFNNNLNAIIDPFNGYVANTTIVTEDPTGIPLENFYSVENIPTVVVREDFAPLIGVNVNMKSGITSSIDYKRGRVLSFSVGTMQLSELRNQDLSLMIGYRKDRLGWNFRFLGKDFDLQNSLNAQLRITMRDVRELNRSLGFSSATADPTLEPQYTRGTLNWIISPSIDYVVNTRINIKLFFEQNINRPYTSQSFNTSFSSGGVQIRFMLN